MGLPQIIIAIILGVVLISMNSSLFGDTFSEDSARATSGTLISQGGQISEAVDTFRAMKSGADPTNGISDLTDNGEFLGSLPNTGISGVTWTLGSITGSPDELTMVAMTTGGSVPDAVCKKAMESAGAAADPAIPDGNDATTLQAVINSGLLYGCYNDGAAGAGDNIFYRR